MKNYRQVFVTTISLFTSCFLFGQDIQTVALTKYTQKEGLSSYFITKIHQDSYGFFWIGTQEGLNLFDGKKFQVFSNQSESNTRLGSAFVSDLIEDRQANLLWVLTSYGDVTAINLLTRRVEARITTGPDGQPLSGKWLRCLAFRDNILWIGGNGILYGYDTQKKKYISDNIVQSVVQTSAEINISCITANAQKQLWLFCDGYGVIILNDQLQVKQKFATELANGSVQRKKLRFWDAKFRNDEVYVASSWGLRRFRNSRGHVAYQHEPLVPIGDTTELLSIAFGSYQQLYFASPDRVYSYNLNTHAFATYRDENLEDDWLSFTYQLYCDTSINMVWVGSQAGIATFRQSKPAFQSFSKSAYSSIKIRHAFSLLPVNEKTLFCGDENGVFRVSLKTKDIRQIDEANANYLLFRDKEQNIFLSNKKGLFLLEDKPKPVHQRYPELHELETDQLSAAVQYNDSVQLFSSVIQKGLYVWHKKKKQVLVYHNDSIKNKIKDLSIINYLYKDKGNRLFILTEKSIIEFHPLTEKNTTHYIKNTATGILFNNFMDMVEAGGSYWLATYGDGLIETDKNFTVKHVFTTSQGISNNCIYRVFSYKDSFIIATTNKGLVQLNCKNYYIKNYYESDGLHSNSFEQVSGYQARDIIYAGGVNGFTIIDPSQFFINKVAPRVFLNNIVIQTDVGNIDSNNIFLSEIEIPTNVLDVTLNFSALNFSNPSRVSYAYKIPGVIDEWVDLGSEPSVKLIGLSPGSYELMFKAANEDSVWTEQPYVITLHYLPKWYQTIWFKISLILFISALLYLFYRYRISQIKKQQQIRKEIASDLHDDIGSTLNAVKVFTHLAKKEPQHVQHFDNAEESLIQVTTGLRDIIWVLDDKADNLYELMERIKKFAVPLSQANSIVLNCVVQGNGAETLLKTEKRNLLLIAKESVNNAVKYAACTKIDIVLERTGNKTCLSIKDNGRGFDSSALQEGNGLKNISHRAHQINYRVQIVSKQGHGTLIEVSNR